MELVGTKDKPTVPASLDDVTPPTPPKPPVEISAQLVSPIPPPPDPWMRKAAPAPADVDPPVLAAAAVAAAAAADERGSNLLDVCEHLTADPVEDG